MKTGGCSGEVGSQARAELAKSSPKITNTHTHTHTHTQSMAASSGVGVGVGGDGSGGGDTAAITAAKALRCHRRNSRWGRCRQTIVSAKDAAIDGSSNRWQHCGNEDGALQE